jgi:hypothetical protein
MLFGLLTITLQGKINHFSSFLLPGLYIQVFSVTRFPHMQPIFAFLSRSETALAGAPPPDDHLEFSNISLSALHLLTFFPQVL